MQVRNMREKDFNETRKDVLYGFFKTLASPHANCVGGEAGCGYCELSGVLQ